MSELTLEQKFMKMLENTTPKNNFVIIPNDNERLFLEFVRRTNKEPISDDDRKFLMELTVFEVAMFRRYTDYVNNYAISVDMESVMIKEGEGKHER